MVDIGLRKDRKDRFAVGGVVDVRTGKEFVDELIHLGVGKDLAVRDGEALSQALSDFFVECGVWSVE